MKDSVVLVYLQCEIRLGKGSKLRFNFQHFFIFSNIMNEKLAYFLPLANCMTYALLVFYYCLKASQSQVYSESLKLKKAKKDPSTQENEVSSEVQ
jgi:hypothetical protein